jgi:hypothetical protein
MCAWARNGTPNTKSSSGDTDNTISDLTAKKFSVFLNHYIIATSGAILSARYSGDSGTNYAVRNSRNGAADGYGGNQPQINDDVTSLTDQNDKFHVAYSCDINGEEKLYMSWGISHGGAGSGSDPDRVEAVGKYNDGGSLSQITQFGRIRQVGSGTFDSGSNLSALGTD